MNVVAKGFTFNGISSSQYDIAMCTINSTKNSNDSLMTWDINKSEITPHRHSPNYYCKRPSDVLKFDITLVKCNGESFSSSERREIVNWLTSPRTYSLLTIEDFDNSNKYHDNIEYFAIVTGYSEFTPMNNVYGMTFNFECNSMYGYSPLLTTPFTSTTSQNAVIYIDNTSDEEQTDYYPIISLQGTSSGEVTLTNNIYPYEVMMLQVKNGQDLLIDCERGDIKDLNTHLFDYETDTNLIWLKLANGLNTITITGDCTGEFQCRYIRKVGI